MTTRGILPMTTTLLPPLNSEAKEALRSSISGCRAPHRRFALRAALGGLQLIKWKADNRSRIRAEPEAPAFLAAKMENDSLGHATSKKNAAHLRAAVGELEQFDGLNLLLV